MRPPPPLKREPHDPLLLSAAAGSAAVVPIGLCADGRALVVAALTAALRTIAGARLAAAAAVTIRAAKILTAVDCGHAGHEAQSHPEEETIHGKPSFAWRN